MHRRYHVEITAQALKDRFSRRALQVIIQASLVQDRLRGQMHPEYHFDASHFTEGLAYMAHQRELIHAALASGNSLCAWQAFGRLTHAAQDFYAHSNYVRLWLAKAAVDGLPEPLAIDPLDLDLLESPALISGRLYLPWELLSFVPGLEPLMCRLLPADSHTRMNLDTPGRGALFAYACVAARVRTAHEFQRLAEELDGKALALFTDR